MSDIHEMTNIREPDPAEMADVEGGVFVGDDYCGTPVPRVPIPLPPQPIVSTVSVANVLPAGLYAGTFMQ